MTTMRGADPRDAIDDTPGDEIDRAGRYTEIGLTGVKRISGYVTEEFLPQLRGRKAVQIFREMADNSAIASAYLYAIERLIRQIEWRVEPASSSAEDRANAKFLEECKDDMEHSWGDMISEIMSMGTYGWNVSEVVYKRRIGPWERDPKRKSKFTDGRAGWRKISTRAQETLLRWKFDDKGDILAMVQMAPPFYEKKVLGMDRCLLFRTTTAKNNPEGRSLLRSMYASWFFLKRFQEIEAVGVERDLAGIPVAKIPQKYLNPVAGSKEAQMLAAIKQLVTGLRRNEQEGVVWPSDVDPDTKAELFALELLTSGGSRQFDTEAIINRYKTEMLMAVLADFMMVGHEDNGGSYALHTDKSGMFRTSLNSIAQSIAEVFNRDAVPRLFAVNGMKPDQLPKIVPNDVDPPDLTQLAAFITSMAGAGMQFFPDPVLEGFLRDAARIPKLDEDTEKLREQEQRQAGIISLAQQKLEAVQIEQQAQQGELQLQSAQMGNTQQAQQLANPDQGGGTDPSQTNPKAGQQQQAQGDVATQRSAVGLQTDKVKLAAEKAKLQNLRKPASRPPTKKTQVKKSQTLSAFGIDHGSPV